MEWQPIETAPLDGTPVRLKSENFAPAEAFWWSDKFAVWQTRVFAVAASYSAWWDELAEQPSHWKPIPALKDPA
jgi:hypothetical protein